MTEDERKSLLSGEWLTTDTFYEPGATIYECAACREMATLYQVNQSKGTVEIYCIDCDCFTTDQA